VSNELVEGIGGPEAGPERQHRGQPEVVDQGRRVVGLFFVGRRGPPRWSRTASVPATVIGDNGVVAGKTMITEGPLPRISW